MAKLSLTLLLTLGLATLAGAARAEDKPAPNKRAVYFVKHADAKGLAAALAKHFKGDAEIQAVPDGPANCLLVSAPPAVLAEVAALLEQLDRRPQMVSVELLIVEVAPKKADGDALDEKDFSGPTKDVLDRVEALRKKGVLGSLRRVQLTAVEDQPASVTVGENKPFVSNVNVTSTGLLVRNVSYREAGTKAAVTVRRAGEKAVAVELDLSDSRAHTPEDGIPLGKDEKGAPIRAAEFVTATLRTKLSVPSGHAVAAQGVKTDSKSGQAQTLVIVAARVVGAEGGQ